MCVWRVSSGARCGLHPRGRRTVTVVAPLVKKGVELCDALEHGALDARNGMRLRHARGGVRVRRETARKGGGPAPACSAASQPHRTRQALGGGNGSGLAAPHAPRGWPSGDTPASGNRFGSRPRRVSSCDAARASVRGGDTWGGPSIKARTCKTVSSAASCGLPPAAVVEGAPSGGTSGSRVLVTATASATAEWRSATCGATSR